MKVKLSVGEFDEIMNNIKEKYRMFAPVLIPYAWQYSDTPVVRYEEVSSIKDIPKKEENKKSWGENTTTKEELKKRNEEIMMKYNNGSSIKNLAGEYYLTEASIRRIIRELKDTA